MTNICAPQSGLWSVPDPTDPMTTCCCTREHNRVKQKRHGRPLKPCTVAHDRRVYKYHSADVGTVTTAAQHLSVAEDQSIRFEKMKFCIVLTVLTLVALGDGKSCTDTQFLHYVRIALIQI